MKRVFNSAVALVLCMCMLMSGTVISMAADVGTPANVKIVSVGDSSIEIKWDAVSGAKGYSVERATNPNGEWDEVENNTKDAGYTDKRISSGGTYYYRVRAFVRTGFLNTKKSYGNYSETVMAIADPAQVKGLMTTYIGASSLTLAWNSSEGARGYQIFMYDKATSDYKKIATTSKKTYTVRNLEDRTEYKFKIRSYHKRDGITYGPFSGEFAVTTALPDVEGFKLSKSGATQYTLSWQENKAVSGFQLAKYDVYDGDWKNIMFTTDTSYSVTGLAGGGSDRYKIRTYVDSSGKKVFGNWSSVIVGGTLPGAPMNLKMAPNTDNGLSITWDVVEGAAGYEVYCCDETGNWESVGTTDTNHFNHRNLTEKKTYQYKVRAYVGNVEDKMFGHFGETVEQLYVPIEIPEEEYPEGWQDTGIIGYLYDPNEKCFYTADDPWQRNFGYSELYDAGASLVAIIIETCRLKFAYDNRDWMIQLWKGQYGFVLYGAEIGIYTKDINMPLEHFKCANDEDMLQMEMVLYEKKTVLGRDTWVRTFGRPYERQWWHTGFVWGNMIGRYDTDLKMYARITMRDYAMLNAVEASMKAEGFVENKDAKFTDPAGTNYYYINGLDICFFWV